MDVTPFGDTPGVSTQLRLVETAAPARPRNQVRRARPAPARARRAARWNSDWRLDAGARQVGRKGVAAARDQLIRASDADLRQAS